MRALLFSTVSVQPGLLSTVSRRVLQSGSASFQVQGSGIVRFSCRKGCRLESRTHALPPAGPLVETEVDDRALDVYNDTAPCRPDERKRSPSLTPEFTG